MAESEITVEILRDIRDEIRGVRTEVREQIGGLRKEVHEEIGALRTELHDGIRGTNAQLDVVETTLLDLAEQQRFIVRYTRVLAERDSRIEGRVGDLELRVDKLESK